MDRAREYNAKCNKSVTENNKYHIISLICAIKETKQMKKKRERQTKEQTLKYREKTD